MLKEVEKVVKNLLTCDLCGKKLKLDHISSNTVRRENANIPAVEINIVRILDGMSADICSRCTVRIKKLFVRMAEPKQRKTKS